MKWAGMGCQISKEGNVIKEERVGERREENGRFKVKNEAEWIERQAAQGKIAISLDGAHAVNSITTHTGVTQKCLHSFLFATTAESGIR